METKTPIKEAGDMDMDMDIKTIKIPINIPYAKVQPYFFIKYALNDKRYRISASFKYLNDKYGLHINIIRNLDKAKAEGLNLKFISLLLYRQPKQEIINTSGNIVFRSFKDPFEKTEVFSIEREFNNEISRVLVFFSSKWWSLNDYINNISGPKPREIVS